ncbi:MAG: ATP-dependent zinc metalloprotease FtsH [Acidimicrobiales bacterium]|nr:MAG: ATP-dependent metallopeptidase FtsH/Yme1/Tma family protein [Actinomycetota bacterium]MBV6510286.1 ATP-dependent zinc metalloprotease FtsH [Acidimicrobiales bacterium]RIK03369.1 MAG: cell division protein FtsH [Acidobacteriota bacterium]
MSNGSSQPPPPPPPPPPKQRDGGFGRSDQGLPRWTLWLLLGIVVAAFLGPSLFGTTQGDQISYNEFLEDAEKGRVDEITWDNLSGEITGKFKPDEGASEGEEFATTGPLEPPPDDLEVLNDNDVKVTFETPQTNIFLQLLPLILPVGLLIGFFWWMQRRAQGQMSGIMSIGRSRAKTYSTERPGTTFADVAGYEGVKAEITEVVDFLREPERFAEVGARIPKGVLLVGPPGTGKTLIARAVAGEAGVPFLSVTGSDFMEMFVGVGASRVRDLFESARKMGRAIIFIDEIDSIGRKRGAGLGGGHDEREQTLNQMLSEMDGFETTEGIVMMAATNRPDILDPALLRPGRFDRQVVVPLPELEDRRRILDVHVKHKRLADDVDPDVIARGTPGMSGADLANLVNEAALAAVRDGCDEIHMKHFEMARDKVLMGQKRESLVLSDEEKEAVAYHEAGHAVCAAALPNTDPLHKVTIIPSGMALGVTMTLPEEDRHIHRQDYLEDMLVMRLGGRIAEDLVFGVVSTGAQDDLQGATEMARRMVREWGMSDRIGPMAWGAQGQVFLGEELMHTRDYSDTTAHIIDEEVEHILRNMEDRCRDLLTEERNGLDLVARALLEHETIDGLEVNRLIEVGRGNVPADGAPGEEPAVAETATDTPFRGEAEAEGEARRPAYVPSEDGDEDAD